jgi:hypothetical protein
MVIAMTVAGCGKTEDGKESKARTITRDVTETVTGYRAIKHGQQAQDRIRKIDAEHKARNDAILNDM